MFNAWWLNPNIRVSTPPSLLLASLQMCLPDSGFKLSNVSSCDHSKTILFQGVKKDFEDVVKCNIGDCHAVGQNPITFIRQVSDD